MVPFTIVALSGRGLRADGFRNIVASRDLASTVPAGWRTEESMISGRAAGSHSPARAVIPSRTLL